MAVHQFPQADDVYPAGLLRRLGAMIYDGLLIIALAMVISGIGVLLNHGEAVQHPAFSAVIWMSISLFFAFFWRKSGQTLGMQAWRLRVQTDQAQPINFRQTVLRLLGGLAAWACLGLGFFWLLWDPEKRAWPDLLSGTRIMVIPTQKHKKQMN